MENYIILTSKTHDALEDFVKTQLQLEFKMKEYDRAHAKFRSLVDLYDTMSRQSANYLVANQQKMENVMFMMREERELCNDLEKEVQELEAKCLETEQALTSARKAEREYVSTIIKNEKTE